MFVRQITYQPSDSEAAAKTTASGVSLDTSVKRGTQVRVPLSVVKHHSDPFLPEPSKPSGVTHMPAHNLARCARVLEAHRMAQLGECVLGRSRTTSVHRTLTVQPCA